MRVLLTFLTLILTTTLAHADTVAPAPPPTALTCSANPDCPSATVCSAGVCVEPPAVAPAPVTPPPVTPPVAPKQASDVDAARAHLLQGTALYNDGNYSGALAEFTESYRLNPDPVLLNNLGSTQQQLFRYPEAIDSYQRYLDASPALPPAIRTRTQQIIGEMKALLADVTLEISPAGATITVDGRPAGTTPLAKPIQIAAGTHAIEVTAEGYTPQKQDLMVSAGVPIALKVALVVIPKTGKARITTSVPRATISIDGHPVGIAPLEIELGPGGHTLEVSAPSYQVHRGELTVAPGQTRDVPITLDKELVTSKPWYMNKYVWAAAGVVVVGIGLGIEFGTRQGPIDGTLGTRVGGVP